MRLRTRAILREQSNLSNDDTKLVVYDTLMRAQSECNFKFSITITFTQPITDRIALVEFNRKLKRFINRYFYRRKDYASPLKFLFVIEAHDLQHKSQDKFHIHLLLSEPVHTEQYNQHLDNKAKLIRIKQIVEKQASRIKSIVSYSRCKITDRIEVELLYDQENLSDYLSKTLRISSSDLLKMIDLENSDIRFFNDDNKSEN